MIAKRVVACTGTAEILPIARAQAIGMGKVDGARLAGADRAKRAS